MATTPTYDRLGKVIPGINRSIASVDTTAVGRGIAQMGQGISALGDSLGEIAERERKEQGAVELAMADASFQESLLSGGREIETETDYAKYGELATERARDALTASADKISDPKIRRQWVAQQGVRVAGFRQGLLDDAQRKTFEKRRVDLMGSIETLQNIYTDPSVGDAAKAESLKSIREQIEAAEATGLISPSLAKEWRDTYERGSILKEAELKILNDPEFAADVASGVGSSGGAAALLRSKEGFRSNAYWDVNAWRTGYGSDTVTRADGTIERVTKDTVVTRADAERDLARRLKEFEGVAAGQTGVDAWAALSDNARAALISVTYNYGELPSSVVRAIKSGDNEQIAQAVEGLKGHNGGINAKRRMQEAAIIRGSEGIPATGPLREGSYANLSPDERQRLTALATDRSLSAATMAGTQANDSWRLAIATDPMRVSQDEILGDTRLDDGQKATLINSLNSALKDGEDLRSSLARLAGGDRFNPYDSNDRKGVNSIYDHLVTQAGEGEDVRQAVAEDLAGRTGVVPRGYINTIRAAINSTDPAAVVGALQQAQRLRTIDRSALEGAEGAGEIVTAARDFEHMVNDRGMTADQAAQEFIANRDRVKTIGYETLLKDGRKLADEIDDGDVAGLFDQSWLPMTAPEVGFFGDERAAILGDYRQFFIDEYTRTGDADLAKSSAQERMRRIYGVTEMFMDTGVVTKFPPENFYPPIAGTHDYVRAQAADAVEQVTGKKFPDDSVFLRSDPRITSADIKRRENGEMVLPRYQLWYVDEKGIPNRLGGPDAFFVPDVVVAADEARANMERARQALDYRTSPERTEAQVDTVNAPPAVGGAAQLDAVRGAAMEWRDDSDEAVEARAAERAADRQAADDLRNRMIEGAGRAYR